MLRPTVIQVFPQQNYILLLEFDNGEKKEFDVKPYIKGTWFGKLQDISYFKAVKTNGFSVEWPDGQDICPDDLYFNSYKNVLELRVEDMKKGINCSEHELIEELR